MERSLAHIDVFLHHALVFQDGFIVLAQAFSSRFYGLNDRVRVTWQKMAVCAHGFTIGSRYMPRQGW
jgi:hypothetical protein